MKKPLIKQSLGLTLPFGFYLAGGALAIVGGFSFIGGLVAAHSEHTLEVGWIIFLFCLMMGGLALLSLRDGVIIDPGARRIKVYTSVLGIPVGKWKTYTPYPNLIVLRRKRSQGYNNPRTGATALTVYEEVYEIYLASANHIHLILIRELRGKPQHVYQSGYEFAQQLGVQLVRYNPGRRKRPYVITEKEILAMPK